MRLKRKAIGILGSNPQGKTRNYNIVSEDKLKKMMSVTFEVRNEAKMRWAVKAYRDIKVESEECEREILFSDLDEVNTLNQEDFEMAMCRFIVEVKKIRKTKITQVVPYTSWLLPFRII